jgi:guanyl-specific ribonuclease Sa
MTLGRRRLAVVVLAAAAVVVAVWMLVRTNSSPSATPSGGFPSCALATLPAETRDTLRAIHAGGPFPFPRNDGVVFGNREGHLPDEAKGYYHEYTVITPGAENRSTRRVVTGGSPLSDPPQYYYTADHYDSFCLITDAGGGE